MIPIGAPSLFGYLLLLLSFCAAGTLAVWLLLMMGSSGARAWMWRHPVFSTLSLLVLVPLTIFQISFQRSLYQFRKERAQQHAALNVTLETQATLDGIEMPAGTRLTLEREHRLETFSRAEFPHPLPILGVATRVLARGLDSDSATDVPYQQQRLRATMVRLSAANESELHGWRCGNVDEVVFEIDEGAEPRFASCTLAQRNQVEDQPVPVGTRLVATQGTLYTDGGRDDDRWRLDLPAQQVFLLQGITMTELSLKLDAQRRLYDFSGALVCPSQWRRWHYPAGTGVRASPRHLRERYPNAWLLSPVNQAATTDGGDRLEDGNTHVWDAAGQELLARIGNDEAGVLRFVTLVADDAPAAPPAVCQTGR